MLYLAIHHIPLLDVLTSSPHQRYFTWRHSIVGENCQDLCAAELPGLGLAPATLYYILGNVLHCNVNYIDRKIMQRMVSHVSYCVGSTGTIRSRSLVIEYPIRGLVNRQPVMQKNYFLRQ
jgi:hypothetical protein